MLMKRELEVFYPECDDEPLAENTLQADWIIALTRGLKAQFAADQAVFVSCNQFWYPVEGEPLIVQAPDVYAVFGRPKGYRGSWKQWEEDGVPLTVVFEVLSPGNRLSKMIDKFGFYDEYGVEEYHLLDPDENLFWSYVRATTTLVRRPSPGGEFVSPRLGIRLVQGAEGLAVYHPDGRRFLLPEEEPDRLATLARVEATERTSQRLRELLGKVLAGTATPDEVAEARRLAGG